MINLYGSPVSNCYNTVLAALKYLKTEYREHHTGASMDAVFRSRSPMGKVPYIEHGGEWISETSAIAEYLDDIRGEAVLFPGSAVERARQRQLMKFVELYVESQIRRLFPGVFWFKSNETIHIREVKPVVERGLDAISILLENTPALYEPRLCVADFYAFFSLDLADRVLQKQYACNFALTHPAIASYLDRLEVVEFMTAVVAQRDAAMQTYLKQKAKEAGVA